MDKEYLQVPWINNTVDLSVLLKEQYIVSDILVSKKHYEIVRDDILNIVKGCYQIAECREYPVSFRWYPTSKEVHTVELRHFLINLIAWGPLVLVSNDNHILSDDLIVDCKNISKFETKYVDEILLPILKNGMISNVKINTAIADLWWYIGNRISIDFAILMNVNYSMDTFMQLYNSDPEIKEIMNLKLDENRQPSENEHIVAKATKTFINKIKSKNDNGLALILNSGVGIKEKQLGEYAVNQGYRPTLTGETVPIPLNSSIIMGLNKPSEVYMSASGARKSLVSNKKVMGTAGYFAKKVAMLVKTLEMSQEISDCGSTHLIKWEINSPQLLEKLDGKFYKFDENDEDEHLKVINAKTDKHLIGKTIYARSVVTCCCQPQYKYFGPDKGNTVDVFCHKCYGLTSNFNTDIPSGISVYESEEWTKKVEQDVLSTKHLLNTISEKVEFNAEFYKFFNLVGQEITPKVGNTAEIDDIDDWAIYINPDELTKVEELDDDSMFNTMISSGRFYLKNMKSDEEIEVASSSAKEIYISTYAFDLIDKKGLIKFKDLSDEEVVFEIIIYNNELTKPLYDLMHLVDRNEVVSQHTYNSMLNTMVDLFIQSGIDAHATAAEIMVNRLIRRADNIFKRPDFRRDNIGEYQLITTTKALEKNVSPLLGLSTNYIQRQLMSDDLFNGNRTDTSYIDSVFNDEIDTERLIEHTSTNLRKDGLYDGADEVYKEYINSLIGEISRN